jgi:hypothetical protein
MATSRPSEFIDQQPKNSGALNGPIAHPEPDSQLIAAQSLEVISLLAALLRTDYYLKPNNTLDKRQNKTRQSPNIRRTQRARHRYLVPEPAGTRDGVYCKNTLSKQERNHLPGSIATSKHVMCALPS